jgi:putative ABC transport system permease protein
MKSRASGRVIAVIISAASATLRVIGFSQREVAGVLLGELMLLIAAALPVGLLFGRGLATLIIEKVRTETVRLPLVISLHTYTLSVLVVLAASCASFLVVGRMLRQLDMVGVLKARD